MHVLAMVLAGSVGFPQGVSAQAGEEGETTEPNLQEPTPASEPAPEEPALQLQLDDAGVEVVPTPPRTADGYTLEEMELRVKRANIGLGVSGAAFGIGAVMTTVAGLESAFECFLEPPTGCTTPGWVRPVGVSGGFLLAGGFVGMIATGILVRRRKRDRDSLREAHYGTPRRVQWDPAQSRLVF
jgi:hypothetical protein